MDNTPDFEVIVVGAGPVGLSLALGLAKQNIRVGVFEKNASTAAHSRAPAIWSKTQEILEGLGVINDFLEKGIVKRELSIYDADNKRTLFTAPLKELAAETAYPQLLILPQSETEKILFEHLKQEVTAGIFFSCEVTDIVQSETEAQVTYQSKSGINKCSANLVVGADGAHSLIREKIHASFKGKTYPLNAALADVRLPGSLEFQFPRLTTRKVIAVGVRISGNVWRIILPIRKNENINLDQRVVLAVKGLFGDFAYQRVWQSEFKLYKRLSSKFAENRIILAGDAAHLNSPVGGQGMNAGIQDGARLVEVIVKTLKTNDTEPILEFSKNRRREVKKGVNRFTDLLTRLLLILAKGQLIKPIFIILNLLMQIGVFKRRFLKRMAMLNQ